MLLFAKQKGLRLQSVFEEEKLRPSLGEFLHHEDWQTFEEELQEWSASLEPEGIDRFIKTSLAWREQLAQRRKEGQTKQKKKNF